MNKCFDWTNRDARLALDKYEPLVRAVARRMDAAARSGRGLDRDDLRAEGRIAVLEALKSYKGFGIGERTWVRTRIKQRMIDAIRRMDIRSRGEIQLAKKMAAGEAPAHEEERGRLVGARRLVSVDSATRDGGTLLNMMASPSRNVDEDAHDNLQRARLERAMKELPQRQQVALRLGLFRGLTLREIGSHMGISESRVCQLQKRAVSRLVDQVA